MAHCYLWDDRSVYDHEFALAPTWMRFIAWLLLLFAAMPSPALAQEFYFGNDLSYVNQMEDCGAVYRENGEPKDPYAIFADRGSNLVRVRLWVDPYWWQAPLVQPNPVKAMYSDLSDVQETIQRAKAAGMQVLLDFHYSDFWADPGRQLIPNAWKWAANDTQALKSLVYQYTKDVLSSLDSQGLMPEMVQVGNEITSGLLTCTSLDSRWDCSGWISSGNNNWTRHAQILNEAIRAVREVGATSSVNPRIAIHLAGNLDSYWWRFRDIINAGVTDFDIMGLSAYYAWGHFGDLYELEYEIEDMASTFPDYEVMVLETAYPWTDQNFDSLGNIATAWDYLDYEPLSPGKQLEYLTDYTRAVMRGGGTGVVFWEPAWVSTPCRTPWGQGSSHDHLVFFDPVETNFMENGGGRWMERHFYDDLAAQKVIFEVDMAGQDVSQGVYITGDLGHDAGAIVPMSDLGGDLYYTHAYLPTGTTGTLHFLNGPDPEDSETVPSACSAGGERPFSISAGGGILHYKWGACITGIEDSGLPDRVVLHPAYPNPFNPSTTLSFELPRATNVTLTVHDVLGRHVQTLLDGWRIAGHHEVLFGASGLPSGTYLVRLEVGAESARELLTLVR